jgi:hypothetical protein
MRPRKRPFKPSGGNPAPIPVRSPDLRFEMPLQYKFSRLEAISHA